jgi:hypothetical protein
MIKHSGKEHAMIVSENTKNCLQNTPDEPLTKQKKRLSAGKNNKVERRSN